MNQNEEVLVDRRVTYMLDLDGRLYVVESVPARGNPATGEQFFSPATVERLHELILRTTKPNRVVETPVFEYGELNE